MIRFPPPQSWTAAILDSSGHPVGLGVFVQPNGVVTCTHVVAKALRASSEQTDPPPGEVTVQVIASRQKKPAKIIVWHPVDPTFSDPVQDICLLEVDGRLDEMPSFDELVAQEPRRRNRVKAFGYPSGRPPGRFSYGHELSDVVDNGWWQLNPPAAAPAGHVPIGPGFSGSLAWDESEDRAVGIVVAREELTTFLIPAALLREACERCAPGSEPTDHPSARSSEPHMLATHSLGVPRGPRAPPPHDVFLSHNVRDKDLARAVGEALRARGLRVWLDEWELRPGAPWQETLERAVQTARSAAVLCGPSGAGPWQQREMRAFLDEFVRRGVPLMPVLLPGAGAAPELPPFLSAFTWVDLRDGLSQAGIDRLIWGITGERREPAEAAPTDASLFKLWNVPALPPEYRPRAELDELKTALISQESRPVALTGASAKFAVHGMGGVGKSVLAASLARHPEVRRAFPDGVFWLTLGQTPEELLLLLERLAAAAAGTALTFASIEDGKTWLREYFAKRACLLVLDDVWDAEHGEPFNVLGERSKLLVTTRKGDVGQGLGARLTQIGELPQGDAVELFARYAGLPANDLPAEGRAIVEECGELPLALAMAGSALRGRPADRWGSFLRALQSADVTRLEAKLPGYPHRSLLAAIEASVSDLSPALRARYQSLAVFPEDTPIPEATLLVYWALDGLDEGAVQDTVDVFVARALARRDAEGRLTLHDLLHDYVRAGVGDLVPLHARLIAAYRRVAPAGLHSVPNDGYSYRFVPRHLLEAQGANALRVLLLDYRWLAAKLAATGPNAVITDFEALDLASAVPLRLLQGALRLSAHVLDSRPGELASQLLGRLSPDDATELGSLLEAARAACGGLVPLRPTLTAPGGPLLRSFEGHQGMVRSVFFSADGKHALSGSGDGTLKLWEIITGKLVRTFEGHESEVASVALSSDGKLALSGSHDHTLKVWEVETGLLKRTFEGHESEVASVALSSDGKLALSGSHDHTLKVWEVETGLLKRTFKGHAQPVISVALSSDRKHALSGSGDGTLKLWEIKTGKLLRTIEGHKGAVASVAFSSDRTHAISGSHDMTLKLWEIGTGRLVRTFEGHKRWIAAVNLSSDGKLALSGSGDRTLKLWEVGSGRLLRTFEGHESQVMSVALGGNGQLALSASQDRTVKLWDTEAGKLGRAPTITKGWFLRKLSLEAHEHYVTSTALSSDGRFALSGSADGTLKLWEVGSGKLARTLGRHKGVVISVSLSADGEHALSGSHDRTLRLWDVGSGKLVRTFEGPKDWVTSVALSSDGRLALAAGDKWIELWEVGSGELLRTIRGHGNLVTSVALSSDGDLALSGSQDSTLTLWEVASGRLLRTFEGHERQVTSVALSSDGKLALSGSADKTVKFWEVANGRLLRTFEGHGRLVASVNLSSDGRLALSGSHDKTLKLWDTNKEVPLIATFTGDASFHAVALGRDGRLAVAGDALGHVHFFETRY